MDTFPPVFIQVAYTPIYQQDISHEMRIKILQIYFADHHGNILALIAVMSPGDRVVEWV